ncbi:MAG: DUF3800 domain-containing protein [Gordonia sp. (in: high G+C Gram-positive bacteria)]|uniref:DUF3800 domain-containing protein n=1 Tax=Gordonia sp. (in: high G+C Gram-positive bacteria) TaxID=84139 RepID=UPI003C7360EB
MTDPTFLPLGLHTFIDESYGSGQADYYVAAVTVTAKQLTKLVDDINALRAEVMEKLGVPPNVELHGHEIMQGKGGWSALKGQVHESVWICRRVLQAVVNSGARIHMQGVDVPRLNARYRYPDSPYQVSLRHALERVHDQCINSSVRSTVVADILDESAAAAAVIAGYTRAATPGFRPTRLCHIEPMQYVDSRTNIGVQVADIVAYTLRRHIEETSAHPKAKKAARQLYLTAAPAIATVRKWSP